jgi:hemoglobin/transferrin/lactoferrin receptor protein
MVGLKAYWGRSLYSGAGLAVLALFCGGLSGGAAAAQESAAAPQVAQESGSEDAAAGATDGATGGATELKRISVTATRNPIEAFEYPGMVTVIGPQELEALQPSSPDDILRNVPGVEFTGGPRRSGEVPSIRGFSGPDVVVLFDGARQNVDTGHNGRFFIDPSVLRSVEVVRGPASSLYGNGGMGGVIEFRTIDAAEFLGEGETVGAKIGTGYQTVNRETFGSFTGFATPVEGLDIVANVAKRDSGSIELGDGSELTNSDDDIISALGKVGYGFAEHHRIEGSFLTFRNTAEEPFNGQGEGGDDLTEKDIASDTWRLAYNYHDPSNNLIDLDVVTYYTDFKTDVLRLDDEGNLGSAGETLTREVDTIGLRVDNRSRFMLSDDIGTVFTYGGEVYRDVQEGASSEIGEADGVPDADATFYGIFAQAEITVAEPFGVLPGDLLIIPGLRFDSYESSSDIADTNKDHAISPRIGISYLPTDWLMVFASYGQAFRAPAMNEMYLEGRHFVIPLGAAGTVVNRFVANPDLDPQRTETFEFGAGLDFDDVLQDNDRFQVKASHYLTYGKDFIDLDVVQREDFFTGCFPFIPGDCDGTTTSVNVPKAKLWGTEVEASYDGPRFLGSFGYSTIDGENRDTGEKLGVLTEDQFTLMGGVKVPEIDSLIGWRSTFGLEFDKVDARSENRGPYDVHDIFVAWAPSEGLLQGLRVDLGIDNLFDEGYERVFAGVKEPGRNFKGLVSYSVKF